MNKIRKLREIILKANFPEIERVELDFLMESEAKINLAMTLITIQKSKNCEPYIAMCNDEDGIPHIFFDNRCFWDFTILGIVYCLISLWEEIRRYYAKRIGKGR